MRKVKIYVKGVEAGTLTEVRQGKEYELFPFPLYLFQGTSIKD